MSSLITSLNASLAAGDAARLTQAQQLRVAEEASQLRTALLRQGFPASGSITASYTFAVNADGTLTPTETRITSDASPQKRPSDQKKAGQGTAALSGDMRAISPTRAQLSPVEELATFANDGAATASAPLSAPTATETLTEAPVSILARAQLAAAATYARNGDVVYNVNPLIAEVA